MQFPFTNHRKVFFDAHKPSRTQVASTTTKSLVVFEIEQTGANFNLGTIIKGDVSKGGSSVTIFLEPITTGVGSLRGQSGSFIAASGSTIHWQASVDSGAGIVDGYVHIFELPE